MVVNLFIRTQLRVYVILVCSYCDQYGNIICNNIYKVFVLFTWEIMKQQSFPSFSQILKKYYLLSFDLISQIYYVLLLYL